MSGMQGHGTPARGSGKNYTLWTYEWTYTDGSGAVLLDEDKSDQDPGIASTAAVTDGGSGITGIRFPKCTRAWVIGKNLAPGTPATGANHRVHEVTDLVATSGTANVRFMDLDGTPTAVDPSADSRYTLTLRLEYI